MKTKLSIEHLYMKLRGGRDLHVWKPSKEGLFSTKSVWEVIRKKGMACAWRRWLWPNCVPKRISFVSWRAKLNCLPVDNVVQSTEISLVSKCECCVNPSVETIDHVLCNGEVAKKVWSYFVLHLNVSSWKGRMNLWSAHASSSLLSILSRK